MKVCVRILLALLLVVFFVGVQEAAAYRILHKDGAVYDSLNGWLLTTPPHYAGSDWAVDFAYTSNGLLILHRDGGYWDQTNGWILDSPPYYAGTDYARAVVPSGLTAPGSGTLKLEPEGTSAIAFGINMGDIWTHAVLFGVYGLVDDVNSATVYVITYSPQKFVFEYDVEMNGDLDVYGTFTEHMALSTDSTKEIVYSSLDGPEAGTYVRGTAEVVGGTAVITLPDHFAEVTAEEGITVTLTPVGKPLQLYVVEKGTSQIVVGEASGQDGAFDYLVQGVRKGYEDFQAVRDVDTDRAARLEEFNEAIMNR